jgi:hypothetical protein
MKPYISMRLPWVSPPSAVFPTERGRGYSRKGVVLSRGRLPTDSTGTFTLTLTNIVIGSVVRIEIASTGAEVETRTADTTSEVFSVPAYSAGSTNNDLRIKVRKGTSPTFYKPYETLATALVGSGSVYIAQIPD